MAITAKEFSQKPSSYFEELGSYEAFCMDEACALALIGLREQAYKEMEVEAKGKTDDTGKSDDNDKSSIGWLKKQQEVLKRSGRYKL